MKKIIKNNIFNIIIISIIFGFCIISLSYSNIRGFWEDELVSVGFITDEMSIIDTIQYTYTNDPFNLPLFYLIINILGKVLPYGEVWMFSIPIVISTVGIYFFSKIVEKITDKKIALLTTLMMISTQFFIDQVVIELRSYCLVFTLVILFTYFYLKRLEKLNNYNIIALSVIACLMAYTHWYLILFLVFYGIMDLYLIIRKKVRIIILVPYMIACIFFLPYFALILHNNSFGIFTNFWISKPNAQSIVETIKQLLDYESLYSILLIIAVITNIIIIFIPKCKGIKKYLDINVSNIFLLNIVFMITFSYIYSKYFMNSGSIFLTRYFICILPYMYILISNLICIIFENILSITKNKKVEKIINCIVYLIFLSIILNILIKNYMHEKLRLQTDERWPYKECADILLQQPDIFNQTTVVLHTTLNILNEGYQEYYFEKRNLNNQQVNFISFYAEALYYDIVYVVVIKDANYLSANVFEYLENNYQKREELFEGNIIKYYN